MNYPHLPEPRKSPREEYDLSDELPDEEVPEILAAWEKFENKVNSQGEVHPWVMKYLVTLAFCKGWESRSLRDAKT